MNFLTLKPESFGLDISDLSLKIIKLKKRGNFFDLASWGETQIKAGIIKNGKVKDENALAKIIKTALIKVEGEKLKTKYVVASLPEEKAFLQVIQMPKMPIEDLKSAVIYEAENYIPMPIDQVYLDSQVIPSGNNDLDTIDVLIAALPKKIVDPYISCLKKADLKPLILEIESLAISRALIKNELTASPISLIDFGAIKTGFIVFSNNSLRFTSSIPVSSGSFTEIISKTFGIKLSEAEKLKLQYGLLRKGTNGKKVFEALIPALTDLTEQIKKYLTYYQTHASQENLPHNVKKLEKILLCGNGSKLKGFADFLSVQLKTQVKVGNPWINILPPAFQSKKQTLIYEKEESLGFTTALGLALRGVKNP